MPRPPTIVLAERYLAGPDYRRFLRREIRARAFAALDSGRRESEPPHLLLQLYRGWRASPSMFRGVHIHSIRFRLALAFAERGTLQRPDAIPPGMAFRDWLAMELQKDHQS